MIAEEIGSYVDNLILSDSNLRNRYGSLRVGLVRKHYGLIAEEIGSYVDKNGDHKTVNAKVQTRLLSKKDLLEIQSTYVEWRDTVEYLPIRLTFRENKIYDFNDLPAMSPEKWCESFYERTGRKPFRAGNIVCFEGERYEWKLKQTVKRGNGPYVYLVKKKLKPLLEREPFEFFSTELNANRKRNRYTNLLFISGTLDPDMFEDLSSAWLSFGSLWNKFITNIRQQFKGCEYMRAWQSQEKGFPHFHALVYIPFDFSVIPWWDKDNRLTWRIHAKQKLNKGDPITVRDRLKNAWKWGNLDICAVSDISNAFKDMLKYITRCLEGGESDLTNSVIWYFGKQSYSVSRNFEKSIFKTESIDWREPSNADLITAVSSNSNSDLKRIEVFPIILNEDFDFSYTKDLLDLGFTPDPPPKVKDFLEKMAFDCKPIKVNKKKKIEIVVYGRND